MQMRSVLPRAWRLRETSRERSRARNKVVAEVLWYQFALEPGLARRRPRKVS